MVYRNDEVDDGFDVIFVNDFATFQIWCLLGFSAAMLTDV